MKTAKAANLPEAAGWEFIYEDGIWSATYDNTFQFDFFLVGYE